MIGKAALSLLRWIAENLRKIAKFVRGHFWKFFLRLCGAKIGRHFRVERGLQFRKLGRLTIGDDVHIGPGCIIDAPGSLTIGNQVAFTAWNYISAVESVTIGSDTIIGERTSIRDGDHGMALDKPMHAQPMNAAPITIGSGIWIGCGVVVLKGATIGDGAVVGANSVVRGNVAPFEIVAGAPAKVIGSRHATPTDVMYVRTGA